MGGGGTGAEKGVGSNGGGKGHLGGTLVLTDLLQSVQGGKPCFLFTGKTRQLSMSFFPWTLLSQMYLPHCCQNELPSKRTRSGQFLFNIL